MNVLRTTVTALVCAALCAFALQPPHPARAAADCPGDGTVRFGLIPGEDTETMIGVYKPISQELSRRIGCPVELTISSSYSAGIEAMRAKKLDISTFGPLSYVLAHKLANAEALVVQGHPDGTPVSYEATIVTPKTSGITKLRDVAGHTFAYSDPASTSGRMMPAFALRKAGIDPDTGVHPFFAGSHTASFEALRNHKVDAGELNTSLIRITTASGMYDPAAFVTLWRSGPLPASPTAIRGDLPPAFKKRVLAAFTSMDLRTMGDTKHVLAGTRYVPVDDKSYNMIRDMVSTLHIDLEHINE
jgi:phosphonate transport system substrate-binding protein